MRLMKKKKEWKFLLPFLLLAGMMLHSCTDEGIMDAPFWHQAVEQGDNAIMRAAKAMVEGTQGEMSMPDMVKTLGKSQTRAAGAAPQTLAAGSFTIDWEAAQSLHEEDGTVLLVPIKMKQNMAIWRFTVINNKRKAEQTPMHSVLYVKKFNRTGNIMGRVLSYAPSRQYIKKHPKYKNEIDWYNPDHTDYSGLLLVSSLEGTLFHGFNYENGHRQYTFRPNVHAHNHNHEQESTPVTRAVAIADSCQHNHATDDNKILTAQSTVFNMRIISSTSAINTYSLNNETSGQIYCSFCGKLVDDCECLIIDGDRCENCNKLLKDCDCKCPFCGKRECECENGNCLFCNKPLHECECEYNTGGGDGNNNSSNNGNNNNQNQGGNSPGSGSTSTSPPTITGGTAEQRATIQSIVNELVSVYNLNMNGISIELMKTDCSSSAKIIPGYTGIGVCSQFFTYERCDQISKLWHEVYHYQNDDRRGETTPHYNNIESFIATPPNDIKQAIEYMVEHCNNLSRELYGTVIWNVAYNSWVTIDNFRNPIYTQNEINTYRAEIENVPNVSEYYANERKVLLWRHEECMKKYPQ